jgi:hypothetical protein
MWDKIKKLLGIQEPIVQESVKFDQLNEWHDSKSEFIIEVLKEKISLITQKIVEEKGKAKQNLEILESAQLKNPNIPEKAMNFMKGNRDIYIKKTNVFLDMLDVPEGISPVLEFCNNLNKDLDRFGKDTLRPYAILQEFFANEARVVAANMNYIGKHAEEIKKVVKESKYGALSLIKEGIDDMYKKIELSRQLFGQIHKKQKLREDLNKKQIELNGKMKEIEDSGDYALFKKNEIELKEIISEIKDLKEAIEHPFAVMESALKKYHRIAYKDKDLLGRYIESPLDALRGDIELKILDLLDRLDRILEEDKIDMKEMKKHKTQVEIKKLTKDFMSRFLADYGRLKKREADILNSISENTVREKLRKSEEEKRINTSMLDKCDSDIIKLNEEVNKIDIKQLKHDLKDNIKEKLRIEISFS